VISKEFIPEGTVIWKDSEDSYDACWFTREEAESWPKDEFEDWKTYCYQADELHYRATKVKKGDQRNLDLGEFFNHSCDPNTWQERGNEMIMIARKDIQIGDEVTYDYCNSETENSYQVAKGWKCLCGSKVCRGKLTGEEYKDPELQIRYAGRWSDYIRDRIDKLNGKDQKDNSSLKRKNPSSPSPLSPSNKKSTPTSPTHSDSSNTNSTNTSNSNSNITS